MKKMMITVGVAMLFMLTAALPIEASTIKNDTEIVGQKSVNNQPVLISLRVAPVLLGPKGTVRITMRGYDPDGDMILFCYQFAEHGPVYRSNGSGGGTYITRYLFYTGGIKMIEGWIVDEPGLESNHITVNFEVKLESINLLSNNILSSFFDSRSLTTENSLTNNDVVFNN